MRTGAARQRGRISSLMQWWPRRHGLPDAAAAKTRAHDGSPPRPWTDAISPRLRARALGAVPWIAGGLIAFAVLGFLVAPFVLRPVLEKQLSAALDRSVTI